MNFIYDIILNFNFDYYNFYEWHKKDDTINIKKIPLYKVDIDTYLSLKYNDVVVEEEFIKSIYNLTTTYTRIKYDYVSLITNEEEVIGVLFDKDGRIIKRSSLLLDEEEEVIEIALKLPIKRIKLIQNNNKKINNILRSVKEKKERITSFINTSITNNNDVALKYLYYEFYEKEEEDINKIIKSLLQELDSTWNDKHNRLYEVIKIMSKIKN